MPLLHVPLSRRLMLSGASAALLSAALPRIAFASAQTDKRFVLIILRGAMDGMHVVVPYGDRDYATLRGEIAIARPGDEAGAIDLDGFFGLHPALATIAPWYKEGDLAAVHAVASAYRERSHFDGQDMLENGRLSPRETEDGWLNRALALMGGADRRLGLAVGQTVPLVLRGAMQVASWAPSKLPEADKSFLSLVQAIYQDDPLLSRALADGIKAAQSADRVMQAQAADGATTDMRANGKRPDDKSGEMARAAPDMQNTDMQNNDPGAPKMAGKRALGVLADATGRLLADPSGPRIAVFDMGGWDTHAGQGAATGRLAQALEGLAGSLTALRTALGPAWKDTVVAVVTEFGRTAHVNGTRGTDHGTATASLLAGGAIAGGKVYGRWPGLGEGSLYQGRDLMPTTDLRSVMKAVLRDHLGLPGDRLDMSVFPGSNDAKPLAKLIRV